MRLVIQSVSFIFSVSVLQSPLFVCFKLFPKHLEICMAAKHRIILQPRVVKCLYVQPRFAPCFDSVSVYHKFMWKHVLSTSFPLSSFLVKFLTVNLNSPALGPFPPDVLSVFRSPSWKHIWSFPTYISKSGGRSWWPSILPDFSVSSFLAWSADNPHALYLSVLKSASCNGSPLQQQVDHGDIGRDCSFSSFM